MRDVNAQILAMLLRFLATDFAQDVAMRQHSSRMPDEQAKQRVFGVDLVFLPIAEASPRQALMLF
jgi:hypothetical protein